MKVRSFLAVLLAAILVFSVSCPALAEMTLLSEIKTNADDIELNTQTKTIGIMHTGAEGYALCTADGKQLSDSVYGFMLAESMYFYVADEDGRNAMGLIDSEGNEVVPMQYGLFDYLDEDWILATVYAEGTADDYDYTDWSSQYFTIDYTDVYFKGELVGKLAREDCGYFVTYGDYLMVESMAGEYIAYDSAMKRSDFPSTYLFEYDYDEAYENLYHVGSNQPAFVPSCTLRPEQVDQSIMYDDGNFYDLQGNVVFTAANKYDYVYDYDGDYAVSTIDGLVGVVDRAGNEVLPCVYDDISYAESIFASGYQAVIKDEKIGFVDLDGNVTCDFVYGVDDVQLYANPFNVLADDEGNNIILSAAVGELPERYMDVAYSFVDTCPLIAVQKLDGQVGVLNLQGNAVIPFDGKYGSVFDFQLSDDGTVVVGDNGDGTFSIYQLEDIGGQATAAPELVTAKPEIITPEATTPEAITPEATTKLQDIDSFMSGMGIKTFSGDDDDDYDDDDDDDAEVLEDIDSFLSRIGFAQ